MQITLIGLDALGLSLGLALKAVAPEIQIVCHDRERARIKAATQAGAADKGHWNLLTACDGSDLVIVNEPLGQLETELTALARELAEDVVVLGADGLTTPAGGADRPSRAASDRHRRTICRPGADAGCRARRCPAQ